MSDALEVHPRLVEAAVWCAVRGHPDEDAFHGERIAIYALADERERERASSELNAEWFGRLGISRPIVEALGEQAGWLAAVRRVLVAPAGSAKAEGAELFVASGAERSVVICVLPQTLANPTGALLFLRRELMHISDMLDPSFGYEPSLPSHAGGPAHDRLLLDRYRILWNCAVDGRIARRGGLGEHERAERLREFEAAFGCLDPRIEPCFEQLFDGARPSHARFAAIAADPESAFGVRTRARDPQHRCSLCGFPTTDFEPDPEALPHEVLLALRADFPAWLPALALCRQCADLYRARAERADDECPPAEAQKPKLSWT